MSKSIVRPAPEIESVVVAKFNFENGTVTFGDMPVIVPGS
jgi:hypothetical protein